MRAPMDEQWICGLAPGPPPAEQRHAPRRLRAGRVAITAVAAAAGCTAALVLLAGCGSAESQPCPTHAPLRCGRRCVDPSWDAEHCGGCNNRCQSSGEPGAEAMCVSGTCKQATRLARDAACGYKCYLAVDAQSVYWSSGSGIMKVDKAGGEGMQLAPLEVRADDLALDEQRLYWGSWRSSVPLPAEIPKLSAVPLAGGAVQQLAEDDVCGLGLDATKLYWTAWWTAELRAVPKSGGTPAVVANLNQLLPGDKELLVLDLVVRGSRFYVAATDQVSSLIVELPLDNAPPRVVGSYPGLTSSIAADDTAIYWASVEGSPPTGSVAVLRLPLGSEQVFELASTVQTAGQIDEQWRRQAIALDATSLYWCNTAMPDGRPQTIVRLPLDGGKPEIIAASRGLWDFWSVAVDDTRVYWTDADGIMMMPK